MQAGSAAAEGNSVLFVKTKAEVVPELGTMIQNLDIVAKQINKTLVALKQESIRVEQPNSSIMEQAEKRNNTQIEADEAKGSPEWTSRKETLLD